MDSDRSCSSQGTFNGRITFPALNGSITSKEGILIPRLRRYLHEIGDALTEVLQHGEVESTQLSDEVLLGVEEHLTTEGLRRQIVQLQSIILSLKKENEGLQDIANLGYQVKQISDNLEQMTKERDQWKASYDTLQQNMERSLKEHCEKYDELHALFENLTEESKGIIHLSDQSNVEIERLKSEKESLLEKLRVLEAERTIEKDQFNKLYTESLAQIKEAQDQVTDSQKKYLLEKSKGHQEAQRLLEQQRATIEKQKQDIEKMSKKIQLTQETISQEKSKEVEQFLKEKYALEQELNILRAVQSYKEELEKKLKEANDSCALIKKKAKQITKQEIAELEIKLAQKSQELDQWKDAAKSLHACFAEDPKPSRFRLFLLSLNERRSQKFQQIQRLTEENLRLDSELKYTKEEFHRLHLELNEQRLRMESVEYEASILLGELRSEHNITSESTSECSEDWSSSVLKCDQEKPEKTLDEEDNSRPNVTQHTSVPCASCCSHRRKILQLIDYIGKERSHFAKAILEYKNRMHDIVQEKQSLIKNAEAALKNFASVELLLEKTQEDLGTSHAVIQEQKKHIECLKAKVSICRQDDTYILQCERNEALKLAEVTREFYKNEAITFRAIIKALLGWHIQIDLDPAGRDITVTLRPALSKQYSDDASLIFHVKAKHPTLSRSNHLMKDSIEEDVYNMFSDEDFDMHLDGRFADKWDTDADWKNQLSARCSYAAFLAITILTEQNQLLHCSAFLAAQEIKKKSQATRVLTD